MPAVTNPACPPPPPRPASLGQDRRRSVDQNSGVSTAGYVDLFLPEADYALVAEGVQSDPVLDEHVGLAQAGGRVEIWTGTPYVKRTGEAEVRSEYDINTSLTSVADLGDIFKDLFECLISIMDLVLHFCQI